VRQKQKEQAAAAGFRTAAILESKPALETPPLREYTLIEFAWLAAMQTTYTAPAAVASECELYTNTAGYCGFCETYHDDYDGGVA
jgi:hypothetical protein